jgi:hypothetical protein
MDILVSPDDSDRENDEAFALHLLPVTIQIDREPEVQPQSNPNYSSRPLLPTRLPRQTQPVQQQHEQEQNSSPEVAELPGLAHFSSGSDSSQSSLITPVSISLPSFQIRLLTMLHNID